MRLRGPAILTAGGKTSKRVGLPMCGELFSASSARRASETAIRQANAPAARMAAGGQAVMCIPIPPRSWRLPFRGSRRLFLRQNVQPDIARQDTATLSAHLSISEIEEGMLPI